jgi:acetone carboxylase gamma subunit
MIIPIGVDCGMAGFLKENNLRTLSFPFDWNVTYNGVSKCIDDNFRFFTEPLNNKINKYDTFFYHDFEDINLNTDKEKYIRRCLRFMNILETSNEEIIFCRKGHAAHNHYEHNGKYSNIISDIDDAEKLDIILQNKYPQLKYKIIVILICGTCFTPLGIENAQSSTFTPACETGVLNYKMCKSNSDKIEIYNIATPQVDNIIFENLCSKIFTPMKN